MLYYAAVLNAGGDILKFAGKKSFTFISGPCLSPMLVYILIGDALLAFWRCDKNNLQQTVTSVMETGLAIQDKYDNYVAGEDINLRMKIAISTGNIFIYHLGMLL